VLIIILDLFMIPVVKSITVFIGMYYKYTRKSL